MDNKAQTFAKWLIMLLFAVPATLRAQTFGGGSGTEIDPYIISTPAHMQELASEVNSGRNKYRNTYFRLDADLDFSGITFNGIGIPDNTDPTGYLEFGGFFNGNGHTISNLQIQKPNDNCKGLFNVISGGARVENLTLANSRIEGKNYVGGIVGYMNGNVTYTDRGIRNCKVAEDVTVVGQRNVGGILGMTSGKSDVVDCVFLGTVSGSSWVGAITGCSYTHYTYEEYGNTSFDPDQQSKNCLIGGNCTKGAVGVDDPHGTDRNTSAKHITTISFANDVNGTIITTPKLKFNGQQYYDCATATDLQLSYRGTVPTGYTRAFTTSSGTLDCTGTYYRLTLSSIVTNVNIAVASTDPVRDIGYNEWIHISIAAQEYTGSPLTPNVVVTDTKTGSTVTLSKGTDYRLIIPDDIINPGNYTIGVVGMGNYGGQTTAVFNVYHQIFKEGSGTPDDPFIIRNTDDMDLLATRVNLGDNLKDFHFRLVNDLNYEGKTFSTIGTSYEKSFEGHFNGYYHTISNVNTISNGTLFGYVGSNGSVENLTLDKSNLSGMISIGGIARFVKGTVQYCNTTASVSISSQYGGNGGIVACLDENGEVNNCTNAATVSASSGNCGGIVGTANENSSAIRYCTNTGSVSTNASAGGIVGSCSSEQLEIESCINTGEVSAQKNRVGGIAGNIDYCRIVSGCINEGTVKGNINVGGIVGYILQKGSISDCLNLASVVATNYFGGIVGRKLETFNGTLQNNYYAGKCGVGGINESDVKGQAMKGWTISNDENVFAQMFPIDDVEGTFVGITYDGIRYLGAGETTKLLIDRMDGAPAGDFAVTAGTLTPLDEDFYGRTDMFYLLTMPNTGQNVNIYINTATGIDDIPQTSENADGQWYTIDGRRLQGKPTKKGIYIHNGKKVIK